MALYSMPTFWQMFTCNSLSDQNKDSENLIIDQIDGLPSISASKSDLKEHEKRISEIEKKYSNKTIWRNF